MDYYQTLFNVQDKVVFITGAGSGLGQHCAQLFAKLGATIIYADINTQGLQQTTNFINQHSCQSLALTLDVTSESAVKQAVSQIVAKYDHIDVLLNCAAIIDYLPFNEVTQEIWDRTYQVDLLGSWFCAKAVAQSMIEKNIAGSIINMASSLCHRTQKDLIPYNSIKAAVAHMTKSLGLELVSYNIRVNALAPGFMLTNMVEEFLKTDDGKKAVKTVPMQRAAKLQEIEGVILLLASQASSYMSGATIQIDGGLSFNHIEIPEH